MILTAVGAEFQAFMSQYSGDHTPCGHAAVVRNGHHPSREIQTGIGPVTVRIPKVRSRTGVAVTFRSKLIAPYVRKTRSLRGGVAVVITSRGFPAARWSRR